MKLQICLISILLNFNLIAQEARLLRFPATNGKEVVFAYAGDLYTVPIQGGVARKITNHIGYECFPRFSPSGNQLAFTAQYDGNTEIYLMDATGGVPKRLTYTATLNRDDVSDRMGPNNICMTWRDENSIVYRSRWRDFNDWKGQLYVVSTSGGFSEQLPLAYGGFCSYSPNKKQLAYNRTFREFRTWKRYRGGQADDIHIFDFDSKQSIKICQNDAQDIIPMWIDPFIYYLSDRDGRMNLYCYNLVSKETNKITHFADYDCKFPSHHGHWIVFENGGYIFKLDTRTNHYEKVQISIFEDFSSGRQKYILVKDYIENWDIGPDGNRAVFVARGDIFTVPQKNGSTVNMTNTSGIHERNARWSPDGKYIAFISDESGEDEVYIVHKDSAGKAVQLTFNNDNYLFGLDWSPDSKKITFSDRKQRLFYVDIHTKEKVEIATSNSLEIQGAVFSPDNQYIAYTLPSGRGNSVVYIYSVRDKKSTAVTEKWFPSYSPRFSADGKYLFFISERTFNPSYNNIEWNHAYFDLAKIYCIPLKSDTKHPFEPKSDEVEIKTPPSESKADQKKDTKGKNPKKAEKKPSGPAEPNVVRLPGIDFENIVGRTVEVPLPSGNYWNLVATNDKIYYTRSSTREKMKTYVYDLVALKETELGEFNGFTISADGKKMMILSNKNYYIVDVPASKPTLENPLNLDDMKTVVDLRQEWKQIYDECWRQMRDFMYDPNLHGVDWKKMKTNYAALLPYVNHRADLSYIIGELIGELNVGHAYVGGGDYPKAERIPMGLLGARLEKDVSGFVRIRQIYKGENWDKKARSPLTEAAVNAREGDFILAVNGTSTKDVADIYQLLVGKADRQVKLVLNQRPEFNGSRVVTVVPVADEQKLIYYNWVQKNIDKVEKATNGRVGYVHIPNMGPEGLNEFVKYFYPQLQKEALIVDDRGNGGGNVSSHIIERLRREPVQVTIARNSAPSFEPADQIVGPKVALIDEYSASDGDIFAYRFKLHKLGPVVGKRSWGGVVGIRSSLPIVDGGFLNRPEFARYNLEGTRWEIEGHGVDPDIWVENDLYREYLGEDQQLDKAIEIILEKIRAKTFLEASPPPYPIK